MSLTKTVGLFAGTTLAITGAAFASTEANTDAMREIENLKKELAALKQESGANFLNEARAAEIKGLVQDVLADADTRSSLQGAGATAGWDNGFFLSSADGNFRLNIQGGGQIRWTWNHADVDDAVDPTGKENSWGFAVRRTSLAFAGHIVDPSWQYRVSLGLFDNSGDYDGETVGGTAFLNDMWILKDFGGFYVRAGQFNAPYSREALLDDYQIQFLDRSNTNYAFGLGRTQGVELGYLAEQWRIAASYSDGVGINSPTQNRGFASGFSPGTTFAVTGRAEIKLAGTWKQFEKEQSWRGEEFGLLLGVGGYFQHGRNPRGLPDPTGGLGGAFGAAYGTDGEQYGFTADVTADFGGLNATGSVFYFHDDEFAVGGASVTPNDTTAYGFLGQLGFFLTEDFELVGRYEYGDFDNLGGPGASLGAFPINGNTQSTATVGFNWYFGKNRAKWQTDFGYAFHTMELFANNGNGWRFDGVDGAGEAEEGQFMLRTGLTFSF